MKKNSKQANIRNSKNTITEYFLAIATCLVIPLLHFKTILDPVLYSRFTGWALTSIILIFLVWSTNKKNKYKFSFLRISFFIVLLIYVIIIGVSLLHAHNPVEGLTDLSKWLMVLIFIIIVSTIFINSKTAFNTFLKGTIINAFLFSIIGFYQFLDAGIYNNDPNSIYSIRGLMAHKNQFSIALFMLIPFLLSSVFSFKNAWKKASIIALVLVILNILLLQTRAVWLAIFFSLIITGIFLLVVNGKLKIFNLKRKMPRKILLISFLIFVAILVSGNLLPGNNIIKQTSYRISTVFDLEFTSNKWRIDMWKATYQLFEDNPVYGVGSGNWKIHIYPYYGEFLPSVYKHWRNPHNDYLNIAAEKGIIGILGFIAIFISLFVILIKIIIRTQNIKNRNISLSIFYGVTGYMIISFFSFPNERINHLIYLSVMIAAVISIYFKDVGKDKQFRFIKPKYLFIGFIFTLYFIAHYGFISLNSEYYLAKVQKSKSKHDWRLMKYYADKAYSPFAPIEAEHSFPVVFFKGLSNFYLKNYSESLKYFKEANRSHPSNVSIYNNIGSVYGILGQNDSAMVYYKKTLEIFPHYGFGLVNLAKAYYMDQNFVAAYQTILSCDPMKKDKEVIKLRSLLETKLNN